MTKRGGGRKQGRRLLRLPSSDETKDSRLKEEIPELIKFVREKTGAAD